MAQKRVKAFLFGYFLIFIPLLGILFFSAFNKSSPFDVHALIYYSVCDRPIPYAIGSLDPRFGISKNEFESYIKTAEAIWEDTIGKNLFEQDPKGPLSVGMEYDKRQFLSGEIDQLDQKLRFKRTALDVQIAQFEKSAADFQSRLNSLNDRIEYWNSQGGAPQDEYDRLIQEQNGLKIEADSLNEMARTVNRSSGNFNSQVRQLNKTVQTYNTEIQLRPEEGIYNGREQKIVIFLTKSKDELVHTLAHEFGHALGISHVNSKDAIMFPYSSEDITLEMEEINELKYACRYRSRLELLYINARYLLSQISENLKYL